MPGCRCWVWRFQSAWSVPGVMGLHRACRRSRSCWYRMHFYKARCVLARTSWKRKMNIPLCSLLHLDLLILSFQVYEKPLRSSRENHAQHSPRRSSMARDPYFLNEMGLLYCQLAQRLQVSHQVHLENIRVDRPLGQRRSIDQIGHGQQRWIRRSGQV